MPDKKLFSSSDFYEKKIQKKPGYKLAKLQSVILNQRY